MKIKINKNKQGIFLLLGFLIIIVFSNIVVSKNDFQDVIIDKNIVKKLIHEDQVEVIITFKDVDKGKIQREMILSNISDKELSVGKLINSTKQ